MVQFTDQDTKMGLTDFLRMASIFDPKRGDIGTGVNWPPFGGGQSEPPLVQHPSRSMDQAEPIPNYHPGQQDQDMDEFLSSLPHPALDRYADLVNNMPVRQNPSPWRYLGGGLLSALQKEPDQVTEQIDEKGRVRKTIKRGTWNPFGMKEASAILNAPYEQKFGDWSDQVKAAGQAATLEERSLNNRAMQEYRRTTAGTGIKREDRLGKAGEERAAIQRGRLELENKKHEFNVWLKNNPEGKVMEVKGGNYILINPRTGENIDTEIPTGTLSDREKIELQNQNRLQQIGAQGAERIGQIKETGAQQRETEGVRHAGDIEEIEARGAQQRQTKATPGSVQAEYPTQQKVGQQLRANQIINQHPEWKGWIYQDANTGLPAVKPSGWNGPDPETRKKILQELYGTEAAGSTTPVAPSSGRGAPPASPSVTKETPVGPAAPASKRGRIRIPPGEVLIVDAQGNPVGTIPESQRNSPKLKEKGYKVVEK